MYVPNPYQETRREVLLAAIAARGFGTLISHGAQGIQLSHIPFVLHEAAGETYLLGHLARANPQWRDFLPGPAGAAAPRAPAVAAFLLDDAYISPGWYPTKAQTGRAVPTWNYVAVEARGEVELVEAPAELLALVDRLTDPHEAHRAEPWRSADAPADFTAGLLRAIIGIRLHVRQLQGAWKLDQKKPDADRAGAARGLAQEAGGAGIAELMLQRLRG